MKNKTLIWQGLNFLCKYFHYFVCNASNRGISRTQSNVKSSPPYVLLQKGVLKIRSKFTEERSYRSVISVKLLSNFTETTLQHGCSPVNLPHIFRTHFPKNISGWLLLFVRYSVHLFQVLLEFILFNFNRLLVSRS